MRYGPNVSWNVLSHGGEDEVCTQGEELQCQLGKTVVRFVWRRDRVMHQRCLIDGLVTTIGMLVTALW